MGGERVARPAAHQRDRKQDEPGDRECDAAPFTRREAHPAEPPDEERENADPACRGRLNE